MAFSVLCSAFGNRFDFLPPKFENPNVKAFKPHLQGLPSYPYKKVDAATKLDQNESPYDLPAEIKAKALHRLQHLDWNRYPDLHAEEARHKLADWLGWPADGLVVSPGSNLLIQALAQASSRVLDTAPAFPHYAFSAKMVGVPYKAISLGSGFELPLEPLLDALSEPSVLFLPNPHAPTGRLFEADSIQKLAQKAGESEGLLVIDEAYHQFSGSDFSELARGNPNVAILRTFSKAWGLGGIRVGYLMASPEICNVIQNFIPPFGLPAHTSAILLTVLENPQYTKGIVTTLVAEREKMLAALQKHPTWQAYPSQTNFILIRTPNALEAYRSLLKHDILVRRQDHYAGLEGCIRVSVGTPDQNQRFIEAAFGKPVESSR